MAWGWILVLFLTFWNFPNFGQMCTVVPCIYCRNISSNTRKIPNQFKKYYFANLRIWNLEGWHMRARFFEVSDIICALSVNSCIGSCLFLLCTDCKHFLLFFRRPRFNVTTSTKFAHVLFDAIKTSFTLLDANVWNIFHPVLQSCWHMGLSNTIPN